MNKNDHIDDIFKDAFEGMEASPNENLWNAIADDISGEGVDDLFKEAFEGEMELPSDKVWDGVKEHLPLDLRLKRSLNSLSIIAGIVVVGMLIIISLSPKNDTDVIIPAKEDQEVTEQYNIEIAIQEVETEEEIVAKKEKPVKQELAVDNSIKDKIQSVELNEEEVEFEFHVDEEKMKGIMKPITPLPVEYAVASSVEGFIFEAEEEIVAPENLDAMIIEQEEPAVEIEISTEEKEEIEEKDISK